MVECCTGIGLYIHVPFCFRKCRYCDFYSVAVDYRDRGFAGTASDYAGAVARELGLYLEMMRGERGELPRLTSIYLGGGTPTVLGGEALARIIGEARAAFPTVDEKLEVTVEANPDSVDTDLLRQLSRAGVNRVSLGVQSFNPQILRTLGRVHTGEQALDAYRMIRGAGFDNVSLDLMLGLPGQTRELLEEDLRQAVALSPEHVSAYLLKVEPGTPFHRDLEAGELTVPDEDQAAEIYSRAVKYLKEAGYHHYEISNLARTGRESRHNLIYWENREYLGLGPAAHSSLREEGRLVRRANVSDLGEYLRRLSSGELPIESVERVDRELEMAETMFLGLRRMAGIRPGEFESRFGQTIEEVYPGVLERLTASGLIIGDEAGIRLTGRGILLANEVFIAFLP
ncbi:MAG: radical SAM family heme chaperone HemW [Firmicutes bacterium]|nr:radical SAM family heme chaperone HemW [Bacillota bacterium]